MTRDFDDRLSEFLAEEGRRAALGAPSLEEAVGRLAPRLAPDSRRAPERLVAVLAAALLLAAALGSAIAVGNGWLRLPLVIDTPSIQSQDEVVFEVPLHYYTTQGGFTGGVARVAEPTGIHARLPAGWVSTGSGVTNGPEEPASPIAVSFWTVDAVFIEPCNAQGLHGADPPMMRTLEGLVEAFTLWWSAETRDNWWANPPPDLPSTTRPIETTVSGFRARHLELHIPATVDVNSCTGGRYATWRNADNVERRHGPGEVSRIWIVEVGLDQRTPPRTVPLTSTPLLVIDATSVGDASSEALRELEELIDSIRIAAPEIP